MRIVFGLVLLLGVGLAGISIYIAQGYMDNLSSQRDQLLAAQRAAPQMVEVLILAADREYGDTLAKEDVKSVQWQADSVPDGAFVDAESLFPPGKADRFVVTAMQKFEPVLVSKVTEPGKDAGITSRLAKGMRAFAIKVDVSSGVSGFLRPGDKVDVYWTGRSGERNITKLIDTSVELIAVDQKADAESKAPSIARTITVEASPQQVAALAQAQSTGRLSLSLVGNKDESIAEASEVDQRSLLGIVEAAPIQVASKQVCTTKIRRGAEIIHQERPCAN